MLRGERQNKKNRKKGPNRSAMPLDQGLFYLSFILQKPSDITQNQKNIVIIQFLQFLCGRLNEGRIFLRFIKELTGRNSEIIANFQKFIHGRKRSARGNIIDIAPAMAQIIAHLIFGNTLFEP